MDLLKNNYKSGDYYKDHDLLVYGNLSRRDMRALIFHFLYVAEIFDYQEPLETIISNFNQGFSLDIPLDSKIVTIIRSIIDDRFLLDKIYQPLLANWRFERISLCTKLILRFGIWELINSSLDQRIVINEAIELTKCFAEEGAYRFVNGILDRILQEKLI